MKDQLVQKSQEIQKERFLASVKRGVKGRPGHKSKNPSLQMFKANFEEEMKRIGPEAANIELGKIKLEKMIQRSQTPLGILRFRIQKNMNPPNSPNKEESVYHSSKLKSNPIVVKKTIFIEKLINWDHKQEMLLQSKNLTEREKKANDILKKIEKIKGNLKDDEEKDEKKESKNKKPRKKMNYFNLQKL